MNHSTDSRDYSDRVNCSIRDVLVGFAVVGAIFVLLVVF